MPDLQALLDQIDRLDQQATKGPWENTGDSIDSATTFEEVVTTEVQCTMYCYGGTGKGVQDDNDAEFIALARTALPQLAEALQAVLKLHRPETRWLYEPSPEWGFSTKVELFEFFDLDNEPHDPADVTQWQLCIHCAEVEQGAAEDLGHLTALWPCDTRKTIVKALGDDDDY